MPDRGEVYEGVFAENQQVVLIISADRRNHALPSAIVAPVTPLRIDVDETAIPLGDAEPASGTVLLDFPFVVSGSDLAASQLLGRISDAMLDRISEALPFVFGLL